jgi:hypothetical protein
MGIENDQTGADHKSNFKPYPKFSKFFLRY